MKRKIAKPGRKPAATRRPRPKSRRAETARRDGDGARRNGRRHAQPPCVLPPRSMRSWRSSRASRARIVDLEARIDIDPLTETLNRRGFERELKRSLAYVKRYGTSAALLYLDLDGFKPVNDRHGHAAGDAVLKAVAAALQQQVRASDVVARLGGDEFAVLLWNVSGPAAAAKAAGLEAAVYATPGRVGRFDAGRRRLRRHGAARRARYGRRGVGARRCRHVRPQGASRRGSGFSSGDDVGRQLDPR